MRTHHAVFVETSITHLMYNGDVLQFAATEIWVDSPLRRELNALRLSWSLRSWLVRRQLVALILATVLVLAGIPAIAGTSTDWGSELLPVTIVRVIDGDTVRVLLNGQEHTVRLIGVDTPETVHPRIDEEVFGKEASDFTRQALEGKDAWLELDAGERDAYGRLLAYVWTSPPETWSDTELRSSMHNASLLLAGYAQLMTIPPNVKHVKSFAEFQAEARESERGLWGQGPPPIREDAGDPTGQGTGPSDPVSSDVTLSVSGPRIRTVDLNTASLEELQLIIHIGPVRAQAIIDGRPWESVDDLDRISGIGPARLADIKAQGVACVSPPQTE